MNVLSALSNPKDLSIVVYLLLSPVFLWIRFKLTLGRLAYLESTKIVFLILSSPKSFWSAGWSLPEEVREVTQKEKRKAVNHNQNHYNSQRQLCLLFQSYIKVSVSVSVNLEDKYLTLDTF